MDKLLFMKKKLFLSLLGAISLISANNDLIEPEILHLSDYQQENIRRFVRSDGTLVSRTRTEMDSSEPDERSSEIMRYYMCERAAQEGDQVRRVWPYLSDFLEFLIFRMRSGIIHVLGRASYSNDRWAFVDIDFNDRNERRRRRIRDYESDVDSDSEREDTYR